MGEAQGKDYAAAVVLVAKFPRLGKCKTRLAAKTSPQFSRQFAMACIKDLVDKFALSDFKGADRSDLIRRVILFAPGSDKEEYRKWLDEECPEAGKCWELLPMREPTEADAAVGSLGAALGGALIDVSATCRGPVSFIGMDTPDLPVKVVEQGIDIVNGSVGDKAEGKQGSNAFICPADDGGYVLLTLPSQLASQEKAYSAFTNVAWSTSEAGATQVKALEAIGLQVSHGPVYSDVDELEDLKSLRKRLESLGSENPDCKHLRVFFSECSLDDK